MNTEVRLLLAVALMVGVIYLSNIFFPGPPPSVAPVTDSTSVTAPSGLPSMDSSTEAAAPGQQATDPLAPDSQAAVQVPGAEQTPPAPPTVSVEPREIVVEGPLWSFTFSNYGARLTSAVLAGFDDLSGTTRLPVDLIPEGATALGKRIVAGSDTVDLAAAGFESDAPDRIQLAEGDAPEQLTFSYRHPDGQFGVDVIYTFDPMDYLVGVQARVIGVNRPLLLTELGEGIAFTEADSAQEARVMSWVENAVGGGIKARGLSKVEETELFEGPFRWAAVKSKYFLIALLPGSGAEDDQRAIGGVLAQPLAAEHRASISATLTPDASGIVEYRLYLGPQEYDRLKALGDDMEEVNPYGFAFIRPIIRPFVGVILALLNWMHGTFALGYGWVLVIFGVAMRVVLWPLNQKAMRAQIRNMAVQPLIKEIQTKHKENPKKQQEEMMRLYKEHGFNPIAGCLPMLLPFPVLIALFFVFQNAIELRGVSFLWLPDLSAKDPIFLLPVFLAVSMFLIQYISFKSMPDSNPQMKMMMWFMPIFLGFIFLNLPSGLNLYYATANIATIPQQILIANERKKMKPIQPGSSADSGGSGGGGGGKSGKKKAKAKR